MHILEDETKAVVLDLTLPGCGGLKMLARAMGPFLESRMRGMMSLSSAALVLACGVATAGSMPPPLRLVADVPMPGEAVRFDYQSLDPVSGRLYISHMNADQLVVFDTRSRQVVANLDGFARVHGVWAVPGLGRLYVSSESGTVSVFKQRGKELVSEGEMDMPHAHTVCVDPATHLVYLPLENLGGHPILRIMEPSQTPEAATGR